MASWNPVDGLSMQTPRDLRNVFVHVTRACNLRCRYCYLSAGSAGPDELSTKDLVQLWPQVVAVRPRKLVLTGGEPLLRPDVVEFLCAFREADPEHEVVRSLSTNGQLVTFDLARQLVGLVDEVRVSLDALERRNDFLRGAGSFITAVRALDVLRAAGFEPIVLVTLTSTGLPDLEELICFLLARGLTRVHLNGFRPVGRGADHWEWLAPDDEATHAARPSPKTPLTAEPGRHNGISGSRKSCTWCGGGDSNSRWVEEAGVSPDLGEPPKSDVALSPCRE